MQHKLLSQSNRWQAVWQTRFISVSTLTDKQKYLHVGFLLSQTTTESHIDSLFIQPAWSHTSWSGIRDVVSVKHQRVQDCKSKAIPLWITHPEGIPRERSFGEPCGTEFEERERSYICQQSHRLFIQPNHRINNVYKVQWETINSGNTATEKTFR